jgi:hypothetical protein
VPPLGGTSRLPALDGDLPRKGRPPLDLEDALRRTVDQTPPLTGQAGDRTPRGARSRLPFAPLRGLPDRPRRNWLSPPAPALDPPLREEQVCGGPPCCQVDQLSWDFVPRRLGSKVRAANRRWLMGSSGHPYEPFASGGAPRCRDATTPISPTACVVEDADPRSPEPDELSPAGVSFESRRFR